MAYRALDLYSGIGGWTLGLEMAGVETVRAFEWWDEADDTHRLNFPDVPLEAGDIRGLPLSAFPDDVDFVVGSPPCTQFSFANRGGNGDITDGLKDVEKFLEVVDRVRPRHWVMENVPRVAHILRQETAPGRSLARFADLFGHIVVVNMAEFGVPQRRQRMLAGDFPAKLLESYRGLLPARTLGDVLESLSTEPPVDPVYGFELDRASLSDQECEPPLTDEETRMNREAKRFHPVYNKMNFPDRTDESARTVTATCTRVSRESIVVPDEAHPGCYRRLSVRERASLQSFPITYQFAGRTYPAKLKMVGNALPPLIAYLVAEAMLGRRPEDLPTDLQAAYRHELPAASGTTTRCAGPVSRYPARRRFRAAIPGLRFGSGVRFELANHFEAEGPVWRVAFLYGTSKSIQQLQLDGDVLDRLREIAPTQANEGLLGEVGAAVGQLADDVERTTLQSRWNHTLDSGQGPYELVDRLGEIAGRLITALQTGMTEVPDPIVLGLLGNVNGSAEKLTDKLSRHAHAILAGIVVGSAFNSTALAEPSPPVELAEDTSSKT